MGLHLTKRRSTNSLGTWKRGSMYTTRSWASRSTLPARFVSPLPHFLPSSLPFLLTQEVTLADLFHIPYGVLLPAAGSNIIDTKPNVARCVEFVFTKVSDFDVGRLNKVVEGHHVPPFLDHRQGWCQIYHLKGRLPRITSFQCTLRVIKFLGVARWRC